MITIKTNSGVVRIGENRGQVNVGSVVVNGKPINLDELPIDLDAGSGNVVIVGTDASIDIQMGNTGKRPRPEPAANTEGFLSAKEDGSWLSKGLRIYLLMAALIFFAAGIALFLTFQVLSAR